MKDNSDLDTLPFRFFEQFKREYDYYSRCAEESSRILKVGLSDAGIRCIVSSRAKNPEKLLKKIQERSLEKKYKVEDDIRSDIVDLAGVRIALYFPSDREKVSEIISDSHNVASTKAFPSGQKKANKRFDGYHADHYRVNIKVDRTESRYCEVPIEIQVGSLLMHAWSEVEHDLVYKPDTGEVSSEEHAILDELNGLVIAGEIALERLRDVIETRVSKTSSRGFSNKYDLASFIYNKLSEKNSTFRSVSNLDSIWGLIRQTRPGDFPRVRDALNAAIASTNDEPDLYPALTRELARNHIIDLPEGVSFLARNEMNEQKARASARKLVDALPSLTKGIIEYLGVNVHMHKTGRLLLPDLHNLARKRGVQLSINELETISKAIEIQSLGHFENFSYRELEGIAKVLIPIHNRLRDSQRDKLSQ